MSLTSGNNVFDLRIAAVVYVVGSVTRWLQHVLNIWPFRTTRICSILQIFCQSRLKIWPIPNWCSYKLPKTLNFLPKWWNFAKSRHTGGRPFDTFVCGGRMQYCKLDKMYFNRPSQKHASNTALVKHHLGRIMVWPPLIERSWVWIPVADEIFQFLKNIFWKGRKINITIHFVTVSSKCVFLKRVIPCLFLLIFTLSHNNKISNFTTSKCEQWSI